MNLEALTFAQGGVSRKDFVPSLQFFNIADGRILGFNGNIAMSSPIDVGISCNPKAIQFIKAIKTCRDPQVSIWVTAGNRLAIKSGGFTGFVDCIEEHDFPGIKPEGQIIDLPTDENGQGTLLKSLAILAPFIAADASRSWARGILFRGRSAYATNNIILIERWLDVPFPVEINIPEDTVYELLRIREEPIKLQICENSATFHYRNDRWLRTCLYATSWPNLTPILDKPCNPTPIPSGMPYALDDLTIFTDDLQRIYFQKNKMSTKPVVTDTGAFFEVEGTPDTGCYNLSQLKLLMQVAHTVDWTLFPDSPCLFFGDQLRGAIVGMREANEL
jgi:hypothetical protein